MQCGEDLAVDETLYAFRYILLLRSVECFQSFSFTSFADSVQYCVRRHWFQFQILDITSKRTRVYGAKAKQILITAVCKFNINISSYNRREKYLF
jgi:hypothetical protein